MASVAPLPFNNVQSNNVDIGRPGQQLLPGYVVKLLKTLKIPFGTDRTMNGVDVDPTIMVIGHIIDCLGALRDINKVYRAKGSLASRSVGTRVMFGFTAELGNILLDSINFEPPTDLSDSSIYYGQIAGSILSVFPEIAAQVTPSTGKVLIHHTALKTSPTMAMESIKLVVKAFPAGAWTADRTGALPLHWVTHNPHCTQDMINFLINANPKGPWVADMDGYLPLHWAVNQDLPNIDVIAALIAANASASAKACTKGSLPLHWCVNRPRPHIGVMRALLQVHPDGVRTFDKTGWLPLHQCVNRSDISLDALQLLIDLYPQGLQCPNVNGQLPLHRALDQNPPNIEAIQLMLEAFPGSAKVADDEGYLAIHLALDCARPNAYIAKMLLDIYPESAFHKSKDGLLPLHCVISSMNPVIDIIEILLQICPDSTESMAVDVVPVDENADPENWDGEWIEKRWTPLSRAIDRGLDAIVMLFRDALNAGKYNNNGIPGTSNATLRQLPPQSQPPINNIADTQFTNNFTGPSSSSVEYGRMSNNNNNGSLVLGGNLDSPSKGIFDDEGNEVENDHHNNFTQRSPMNRAFTSPQGGVVGGGSAIPNLRERAPGGMGPTPSVLGRAPSIADLKIRGGDRGDKDRRTDSRQEGGGGGERERHTASRGGGGDERERRHHSREPHHSGDKESRRHRRSSSRKHRDESTGRGGRESHHNKHRVGDSDADYYEEGAADYNDDYRERRSRHHSRRGDRSSSRNYRDNDRHHERVYDKEYEQDYDDDVEAIQGGRGNSAEYDTSHQGSSGRQQQQQPVLPVSANKMKLMTGGPPPTEAPPRSLLEAAIGRPTSKRGILPETTVIGGSSGGGVGQQQTAIDIHPHISSHNNNMTNFNSPNNRLSADELV